MLDYMFKRPMLLCGIGCCFMSVMAFHSKTAVFLLAFLLLILLAGMLRFNTDARIVFAAILIFVFGIICLFTHNRIETLKENYGTNQRAKLTLISVTYKSDRYYVAEARVDKSDRLPKGTKLTVFYEPIRIRSGQSFIADIKFSKSDGEYKADNYSKGIFLTGNMKNITFTKEVDDVLLGFAEKTRGYIKEFFMDNMDYDAAATLCALIFGKREYFTEQFYDNTRSAGVSHVMVVSGMHLAILVSFLVMILEKLYYNRFLKAFLIVAIVAILTVLCGFTMSVLRAGITYLLMALGIVLDRKGAAENTLGGAVVLILFFSPFAIFSVALQLSLLSTFGILVVALPIIKRMEEKQFNRLLKMLASSVIISLSALFFTLPTVLLVFGYISTVSVISNILISSAVTFALYIAVPALAVNLIFPFGAKCMMIFAELITKYINYIINFMGELPFAVVNIPKIFGYVAVLAIFLSLMLLLACKKRSNMLKLKEMNEKIVAEGGGKLKWHR